MSEYWKSTPKYWCKHCSAYVKDTPFERKQHESTGKHQGNLKRFLRGIQNDHEKAERDKERAKAEVDRLNKVVGGQGASANSLTPTPSGIRKSVVGAPTAADQKRQWQQLAEMGIEVPDNFRGDMAMPGQWQSVSNPTETLASGASSLNTGVRKRKVEGHEEEEEEVEATGENVLRRGWGTTTRRYPGQDDADLDVLLAEPLVKKDSESRDVTQPPANYPISPKSATKALFKAATENGEEIKAETDVNVVADSRLPVQRQATIKREDAEIERPTAASEEHLETSSAPVFKKRKIRLKAEKQTD